MKMNTVYGIVGMLAGIAALAAGFLAMPDVMVVSALFAAFLLIAANAGRIARIKAGPGGLGMDSTAGGDVTWNPGHTAWDPLDKPLTHCCSPHRRQNGLLTKY
jgi:hypothetical protein